MRVGSSKKVDVMAISENKEKYGYIDAFFRVADARRESLNESMVTAEYLLTLKDMVSDWLRDIEGAIKDYQEHERQIKELLEYTRQAFKANKKGGK